MSLMDFVKKQFIDILQWTESGDEVLAWRFPTADLEIQYGASLTVRETQAAIFVNEGKVADVFAPGLYKLTTQTLPVLTYLKNWDKLFESPFKSEVYFFSLRSRIGRRWGTPQAVTIRDKDFGAVQVRAFGQYAWRLADPAKFFSSVSGTLDTYTVERLEEQLRGVIISSLATAMGASNVAFLDLAANQTLLATKVKEAATEAFSNLGLLLESLELVSLSLPDALQEALDTRIRMGMLGDMSTYTRMQAADAMVAAAGNEGGGVAALGAQMAVGVGVGQAMQQALTQPAPAQQAAPVAAPVAGTTPSERLGQLKSMLDNNLISTAEYEQAKQAILAKLVS